MSVPCPFRSGQVPGCYCTAGATNGPLVYIVSLPCRKRAVNIVRLIPVKKIWDLYDLIDSAEVAEILGLAQRNSVTTYLRRYDGMPRPLVDRGKGRTRLWSRKEITDWSKQRHTESA